MLATDVPYGDWKAVSAAVLLVITFACSYVPWGIRSHFKRSKLAMSYLNCLAGGVVLGALLMHMIPEMSHSHHEAAPRRQGVACALPLGARPLAPSSWGSGSGNHLAAAMHGAKDAHEQDHHHDAHDHSHGCCHGYSCSHADEGRFQVGPFCAGVAFLILLAIDRLYLHSHSHSHDHGHEHGGAREMAQRGEGGGGDIKMERECPDLECSGMVHLSRPEDDDCASCHSEDLVGGCHMDGLDSHSSKSQAFIFVLALSMHSFFEGLGAAAQHSRENLIMYLLSLFGHKWLEAFALGVNVLNANFGRFYACGLILFYSLLTPLGIILGMLFERATLAGPYAQLTSDSLNGVAVGSFIFVSCIEMIPPEFHKRTSHTPWKFTILCLGFGLMAALSLLHFH